MLAVNYQKNLPVYTGADIEQGWNSHQDLDVALPAESVPQVIRSANEVRVVIQEPFLHRTRRSG